MSDISVNNKRIAKNTILLYVRMLFLMFISLFTSRLVLDALGEDDYGIYNVVGGIVIMSSFFCTTMAGATQRFLSYSIGKGDDKEIEDVFKTALFLHILFCLFTLVLAEGIGIWLINTQLVIPADRIFAANIVFQFSIQTFIFDVISAPYTAVIVSREKMNIFAYFSILEAIISMSIAYAITIITIDKLIVYSLLLFLTSVLKRLLYSHYCTKHFREAKFSIKYNPQILKKMTSYMGWSLYANMAGAFYGQGINILLNMFFGPTVNAARGLAYRVQQAVLQFATNFQTAVNPQIIKYYASGNYKEMYGLMKRSSRFSFYVLLLLCMPLILTTDIILNIWLKNVPDNTEIFCRIVLIIILIDTISNPLTTATKATGKLKLNALLGGTNLLMILPISYFFLNNGYGPVVVFYINIFISLVGMFIRLYINNYLINFPVWDFITDVFFRGWLIAILAGIIPYILNSTMERTFATLIVISFVSVIMCIASIYFLGLSKGERLFMLSEIKMFVSKTRKNK